MQRRGGVMNYVNGIQNQCNFCFAGLPRWCCRMLTQIVESFKIIILE
jgi:hypothetical protein